MNYIHRWIILVAVLCYNCHCQNMDPAEETLRIVKNLFDRQSNILQKLQDVEMQMNSTKQEMEMEMNTTRQEMEMEMNTTRQEMKLEMNTTRQEMGMEMNTTRQEMKLEMNTTRQGTKDRIDALESSLISSQNSSATGINNTMMEATTDIKGEIDSAARDIKDRISEATNNIKGINVKIGSLESSQDNSAKGIINKITEATVNIKGSISSLESSLSSSLNTEATGIKEKIVEATKKIKALIGRVYCLTEANTLNFFERCYFFSDYLWYWQGAKGYCEKNGGYLPKIINDGQFKFLQDNCGDNNYWIGLTDSKKEGIYTWSVDGSSHDPSSKPDWWTEGEPNNGGGAEDCIEYDGARSKKLTDDNCSKKKKFICEFHQTALY